MSLVTLDEVKGYLGIDLLDTSKDTLLEIFRESVEQQVLNFCDVSFEPVVITNEVRDATQSDVITPKYIPVASIQHLYFNCDADGTGGSELVQGKDFYFDENMIKLRGQHSPFGRGLIRIDYTHGYAAVPPDVKLAVYQAVKSELQRYERNNEDISSIRKQDESVSYGGAWDSKTGLPKSVVAKLQTYKLYEFSNSAPMAQRNI